MMPILRDENGQPLTRNLHRVHDGWQITLWWGGIGLGTNVVHAVYKTRQQAADADISDYPNRPGFIRSHT